jgi:glycine cleavage system aminomethyltransferase T
MTAARMSSIRGRHRQRCRITPVLFKSSEQKNYYTKVIHMLANLTRVVVASFEEPGWDYGTIRGPYSKFHIANGAKYCVYNNRLMPVSQRIDRMEGYWALRTKAGLFDTGERPIQIKGPGAVKFCNRVFTRDCSKIKSGRAGYGLLCYPNGMLLCDGVLLRLAEDTFWYSQADGPVFSWFIAHSQDLEVEISDPGSWILQIQGPASLKILASLSDTGLPPDFTYFSVAKATVGGQPVLLTRTGWTNEMGFEIYTLPSSGKLDGDKLWERYLAAGTPHGMEICGLDSMDIRRIEGGILNNGSDMDETMTPYEAGLGVFVDLTKESFIGKVALEKAQSKSRIMGLKCEGGEPLREGEIRIGGTRAGFVTAGSWSPYLTCGIAIIRLDSPKSAGTKAEVLCRDGKMHPAIFEDLPLYDKEKKIPRGQETTLPVRKSRVIA